MADDRRIHDMIQRRSQVDTEALAKAQRREYALRYDPFASTMDDSDDVEPEYDGDTRYCHACGRPLWDGHHPNVFTGPCPWRPSLPVPSGRSV